jgi:hypothetical protein
MAEKSSGGVSVPLLAGVAAPLRAGVTAPLLAGEDPAGGSCGSAPPGTTVGLGSASSPMSPKYSVDFPGKQGEQRSGERGARLLFGVMFVLATIRDTMRIEPVHLKKHHYDAVLDEIHRKYANNVVHNVGLCIVLFDLVSTEEAEILAADNGATLKGASSAL